MAELPPPTPADTSALVQHYLLYHGARFTSRATETSWRHIPVALAVPPQGPLPGTAAPQPGRWLVVPWEAPTSDQVVAYLERLAAARMLPEVVVLVLAAPVLRESVVLQVAQLFGIEVVAISALDRVAYGTRRTVDALGPMFETDTLERLHAINPLEHLAALGDPRDPEVFFERLKHTGSGAPVTWVLLGANAAVFLAMMVAGGAARLLAEFDGDLLVAFGANVKQHTVDGGQTWRLLACTYVHANLLHIGMNMWVLRSVGETAERLFGGAMYATLYTVAGLGGSIASLAFTLRAHPGLPSVGASGAVFGVMGGLLGFALARRRTVPSHVYKGLLRSALFFSLFNIALGAMMPQVDNAAHIGGLAAGFGAGLLLSRDLPPAPQPKVPVRLAWIALCLGGLGVAWRLVLLWV
ncbi:MAG: rhomboid family intramembrane serine protease [Myxococcales bacterium]|nr:rhomboid family intramembrane serine protease [Myxococcales bacterium]